MSGPRILPNGFHAVLPSRGGDAGRIGGVRGEGTPLLSTVLLGRKTMKENKGACEIGGGIREKLVDILLLKIGLSLMTFWMLV